MRPLVQVHEPSGITGASTAGRRRFTAEPAKKLRTVLANSRVDACIGQMTNAHQPTAVALTFGRCLVVQINAHGMIERVSGELDVFPRWAGRPPAKGSSGFDLVRDCLREPEASLAAVDLVNSVLQGGPPRRFQMPESTPGSPLIEVTLTSQSTVDLPGALVTLIELPPEAATPLKRDHEEASRLRAILDHEPACVKVSDTAGHVLEINPAGLRILEADGEEDVLGGGVVRFIAPEDQSRFVELSERCAAGHTVSGTFRLVGMKGTERWVETHSVPLTGSDGRVCEVLSVSHDVTARHQAEENMRLSQRRYEQQRDAIARLMRRGILQNPDLEQSLQEIVSATAECMNVERVSVWRKDRAKGCIVCLSLIERSSGQISQGIELSKDDFPGYFRALEEDEMISAEDACSDPRTQEFRDCYLKPMGIGAMLDTPLHVSGVLAGVLCHEHVGGPRIWTEDEKSFALSMANLISLVFAQSQHRQDEEKLREQASLLDLARDAIIVRGLDHTIRYWNKSAERLYGWTAQEAIGKDISTLIYRDADDFVEKTARLMKDGEHICEIRQVTKTGEEVIVEGHWTLVTDSTGLPKSILAINTDITARKKAEEQSSRNQRLESIGTLAGGIAHDLNNVLTPIFVSVDMLKLKTNDKACLETLGTISTNARRGADMIRQLLSFARGVEGTRQTLRMHLLLQEIGCMVRDTFPKNIFLDMREQADLWPVHADATQLHQMLLNLCVNARDAMPRGGTLSIQASNTQIDAQYAASHGEARSGPHVLITVSDEGTGMPPELLGKIFDPFFTTKEAGKGTGLGLSTTLTMVKSHGGFIETDSAPGEGTVFRVFLPADPSSLAENETPREEPLPRGSNQLILVIDDEAPVRDITCQSLQSFGYRVMSASHGAEAAALYARHHQEIDAVITDMMMPIMDGPTTIQVLRRLNPQVRIIAASGLSSDALVAKATNAGASQILPKPYSAETLLHALRTALDSRQD